jgi:hypothetical protein
MLAYTAYFESPGALVTNENGGPKVAVFMLGRAIF